MPELSAEVTAQVSVVGIGDAGGLTGTARFN